MKRELSKELMNAVGGAAGAPQEEAFASVSLLRDAMLSTVEVVRLHKFDGDGRAILREIAALPGELVVARATVPVPLEAIGAPVVVVFEKGDPRRPIILGVIVATGDRLVAPASASGDARPDDGDRLVLRAEREIVLQCGDASITLTRAGKVLIRGHYVLSSATGYNRIKGAAIDIN